MTVFKFIFSEQLLNEFAKSNLDEIFDQDFIDKQF